MFETGTRSRGRDLLLTISFSISLGLGACQQTESPLDTAFRLQEEVAFAEAVAATKAEADAVGRPELDVSGEVAVPLGSRLDFYLPLPAKARLRADAQEVRGTSPSSFRVLLATDDDGLREIPKVDGPGASLEWALTDDEALMARLTLEATPKSFGGGGGVVALLNPTIVAPRQEAEGRVPETSGEPSPVPPPRPHIFIFMVDALRADHLGCYGYERPVSPHTDAFAGDAVLFENVLAQSSWTRSSVVSLFTGVWPQTHSVIRRRDRLPEEAETLAELLSAVGYQTAAVITNPNLAETFGVAQGFRQYVRLGDADDADLVVNKGLEIVDQAEGPLLLYLHTSDPHNPYLPPQPHRDRFAPDSHDMVAEIEADLDQERWSKDPETIRHLKNLYDGEISFNDEQFGVFLEALKERGLYESSILIYVSDHGDEFQEHGSWAHGHNLHMDTVAVPLIVRMPGGGRGRRVATFTQHSDLLPTLLELLELEPPLWVEGRSVLGAIRGTEESLNTREEPLFSHIRLYGPEHTGVVMGDWKLIHVRKKRRESYRLYDLSSDPLETANLADSHPITRGVLATLLAKKLQDREHHLQRQEAEIDQKTEEGLRALGYLE